MKTEGDHCERIGRIRLMPLSPTRYTEYNLVQQNASANSKMDEYSENKVAYINIQEIN